jgi:hypothetical protein
MKLDEVPAQCCLESVVPDCFAARDLRSLEAERLHRPFGDSELLDTETVGDSRISAIFHPEELIPS